MVGLFGSSAYGASKWAVRGMTKISRLAETANQVEDPEHRQFLTERVDRLDHWMRSGGRLRR